MPHSDTLTRFNNRLLADGRATAVLEEWCGSPVSARLLNRPPKLLSPEQKDRLCVTCDEEVIYRCVALIGGGLQLSEAHNWYRPHLLTPDMRIALNQTEFPFGKVVSTLAPIRNTFFTAPLQESPFILEHRAVLTVATLPLCEVWERYTDAIEILGTRQREATL